MRWRNTLLLALLVALVAGVAYHDLITEDPDAGWQTAFEERLPTPPSADVDHLLDFEPAAVVSIALESDDRVAGSQRTANGWTGTSTPAQVDKFLGNLRRLAIILAVEGEPSADELESFGLTEPRARIRLERDDGPPIDITLGAHNPSATGIYARVSQRPGVALTGAVVVWDLSEAFDALDDAPTQPPDRDP